MGTDDPEAALDLLDVLEDDPEASVEMQEEMEIIKSNIYLPPEDDYEMEIEEEVLDKEDEEMKEMLALIESAKGELDTTKEEELLKMMDRLDDDEYFEKLKSDVIAEEKAKLEAEVKKDIEEKEASNIKADDDTSKNKRRADHSVPEKEPSKKKTKDSKKKKALAAGGVSIFGGKDLFGGKNPFASRKQEISSDEDDELELDDDNAATPLNPTNGNGSMLPPPPPPMPSFSIAVQADAEEKPVSFDELPTNSHVISSSNKNRATLPSKRRPPGRGVRPTNGHVTNGHSSDIVSETDRMGKLQTNETDDKTNKLTDRLALPTEENEYDGDESEMSHSQIRRGRRSIKRKPPPKGGVALFGGADLFEGKNPFAHRRGDSEEKDVTHSDLCDPSDKESLIDTEAEQKEAAR